MSERTPNLYVPELKAAISMLDQELEGLDAYHGIERFTKAVELATRRKEMRLTLEQIGQNEVAFDHEKGMHVTLTINLDTHFVAYRAQTTGGKAIEQEMHGAYWEVINELADAGDEGLSAVQVAQIAKGAGSRDTAPSRDTIFALRKLDPRNIQFVEKIGGEGKNARYRLNAEVEYVADQTLTKPEAGRLATRLVGKNGVKVVSNNKDLLTFELNQEEIEICTGLIERAKAYGLQYKTQGIDTIDQDMLSKVQKIITEGDLDSISDTKLRILFKKMLAMQSDFQGNFYGFLSQNVRIRTTTDRQGHMLEREKYWVLPNGEGNTASLQPNDSKSDVFIEEVADHPLVQLPKHEVPKAKVSAETDQTQKGITAEHLKENAEMADFLERLPKNLAILYNQFLESEYSEGLFEKLKKLLAVNNIDKKTLEARTSSTIFEQLSYLALTQEYSDQPSLILLAPQEVQRLYEKINPDRRNQKEENDLSDGIPGITFPEGILLRATQQEMVIEAIFDFKLWVKNIPNRRTYLSQLNSYRYELFSEGFFRSISVDHAGIISENRPDFPDKPFSINPRYRIVYVFPQNSQVSVEPGISLKKISVDSRDLNLFTLIFLKIAEQEELDKTSAEPISEEDILPDTKEFNLAEESQESPEIGVDSIEKEQIHASEEDQIIDNVAEIAGEIELAPVIQEPQKPKEQVQKSALEKRDPEIEDNLKNLVAETLRAMGPKGKTLEAFRNQGIFKALNRAIENQTIHPVTVPNGHKQITRRDLVLVTYLDKIMRNRRFTRNLISDLEKLIDDQITRQEEQQKSQNSVK